MKTQKNKVISLSVGICALNEEQNIGHLLSAVFAQKQEGFTIKEVIVVSDGSTDKTTEKVAAFQSEGKIKLIPGKQRLGKATRMNYICSHAKGNAILMLDADITIKSPTVIRDLVSALHSSEKIGLVCGRAEPKSAQTFMEHCVIASYEAYDNFRSQLHNGNNPYSAEGRIMLISKEFAKFIDIPASMYAVDNYLYFLCKAKTFEFRYVKSATVFFRAPRTLHDQIRQNTRFVARNFKLQSVFGDIVQEEYAVPRIIRYRAFVTTFVREPFFSASILIINIYCKFLARIKWKNLNSQWNIASSTKVDPVFKVET